MYVQISIRVTIAEELPNISRSVIHGVSRIVLTDWLNERLTIRCIYIGVDCLEHSRNHLNEMIIAYSRTWDFPLFTDNIVNNLDDSRCVVYVTTQVNCKFLQTFTVKPKNWMLIQLHGTHQFWPRTLKVLQTKAIG
jgi:hypothetical protein